MYYAFDVEFALCMDMKPLLLANYSLVNRVAFVAR